MTDKQKSLLQIAIRELESTLSEDISPENADNIVKDIVELLSMVIEKDKNE